jgi:predicted dehydrogenase
MATLSQPAPQPEAQDLPSEDQRKVRIAVIGVGGMGSSHVRDLAKLSNVELAAVCDIDHATADRVAAQYGVPAYYDATELLDHAQVQAITIATPHYFHTPISIAAFERGIHVLTEKPLAVQVRDGHRMIAAYQQAQQKHPGLLFAIMFQQRMHGFWRKVKQMITDGELGKIVRVSWIITDWFRPQAYYDSGGWRATWAGEGGGVLLNQCPHNLDLYQWFVGMPKRVTGIVGIGKYHNIEVEDEVTGVFEHENGIIGHFVATTAESPGTNRLEIVGENGRLVFENGELVFYRNTSSMLEFLETSVKLWDKVPCQREVVEYDHAGKAGHGAVLENFANAILNGEPLVAPAVEGIRSLTLGNAILFSSFLRRPLDLPFDEEAYAAKLDELVRSSKFQKTVRNVSFTDEDLQKAFGFH